MRRGLILLWLLAGCATQAVPDGDEDAGEAVDAFVAPPALESGVPPPPVPDRGTPPPPCADAGLPRPDMGGGGDCGGAAPVCQPGMRLGLCEVCDACGQRTVPADDNGCPAVDCGGQAQYTRQGNICYALRARIIGGRCLGPGSCRDPDDRSACGDPERMEALRLEGECVAMEGCQGVAEPRLVPAPNGTPCGEGDVGLCQAGACDLEIGEACAAFGETCETGNHVDGGGATPYCQVAAEGENCIAVCGAVVGSRCLAGWAAGAGCVTQQEIGCFAGAPRLICRCSNEE